MRGAFDWQSLRGGSGFVKKMRTNFIWCALGDGYGDARTLEREVAFLL